MSMCRIFPCVFGRRCLLWPVCSLSKTLLAFALLHFVLQGQICLLLQESLDFLLLHSSSLWWKGHLFWVLVLESLVGLHRTVQLQLFQHYWLGHRLGLLWYWMVCLGNEQRSFHHFWDCTEVPHFGYFELITSWQIDGETVETVAYFIFWGSKITADGDCSHEIKRRLLLGRKAVTNLGSILKSRDITLPTKVHLVKGMVFPVVMYGCESWTIKKGEHWRTDAFELWCWRRLLRAIWTARRSNWSVLKEISPEYSLEGLMLKLKLQYFGYLMRRTDSFEKTLIVVKIKG